MQTYEERRPYAVPNALDELTGPIAGPVELPIELGWTGRRRYDLDDPDDAAVFYERVLVDAVDSRNVTTLVNADRLSVLWSHLFLPTRLRRLWETRFPQLVTAA